MQAVAEQSTETEQPRTPVLDRQVDLTRVPAEWFPWAVVALAALVTRLVGRASWPLSPEESTVAYDAWQLAQGGDVSTAADAHPLLIQVTSLALFFFGDTDFTARLVPLLAGLAVVAALFWLRRWIGNLPALSTALVWTLSPVMAMGSLRLDGGAILVLTSLLILGCVFVMSVEPGPGKPVILGIALAAALTTHPLGWLVALTTLVTALALIRQPRLGGYVIHLASGFATTFLLSVTWFLTRPAGLLTYFSESFGTLWDTHLANFGTDWPLTILLLIVDGPLTIVLALTAVLLAFVPPRWPVTAQPTLVVSCAVWAVLMLTLGEMVDGKGPAVFAATLFPLTLVAGMGLSIILDGVRSIQTNRMRALGWALVVLGLVVAISRLTDMLLQGPNDTSTVWLISATALVALIVVPLGYAAYRLTPRTSEHFLPTALLLIVVLLAVVALRGTMALTSTNQDRSGEVLLAGATTPAVDDIQARISRFSRDITTYEQDARDPVGGHGMALAFDDTTRHPFQWYFREFTEQRVVGDPRELTEASSADVLFVRESDSDAYLSALDGYEAKSFPARYALRTEGEQPEYVDLLALVVNPARYDELADVILRRDSATLLDYERISVLVPEDYAGSLWGSVPE